MKTVPVYKQEGTKLSPFLRLHLKLIFWRWAGEPNYPLLKDASKGTFLKTQLIKEGWVLCTQRPHKLVFDVTWPFTSLSTAGCDHRGSAALQNKPTMLKGCTAFLPQSLSTSSAVQIPTSCQEELESQPSLAVLRQLMICVSKSPYDHCRDLETFLCLCLFAHGVFAISSCLTGMTVVTPWAKGTGLCDSPKVWKWIIGIQQLTKSLHNLSERLHFCQCIWGS